LKIIVSRAVDRVFKHPSGRGHHDRYRMVVCFTTICAIRVYHH
jgi:hypothetical protein